MAKWIELHDSVDGGRMLVNADNVEGIFEEKLCDYDDFECYATHIDVVDGGMYQVRETYEVVKGMIWQNED